MAKKEGLKQLKEGILADCGSDVAFYMCNGAVLRSIRELAKAIEELDNDSFGCHLDTRHLRRQYSCGRTEEGQDSEEDR
jgi:hypothetical protein